MSDVRKFDLKQLAIRLKEQKTGKTRKIVINKTALAVMQRRLDEHPKHIWLFQSEVMNLNRRQRGQCE